MRMDELKVIVPSLQEKQKHISKLDIHIVSHGGVASRYLAEYLQKKGIVAAPHYTSVAHLNQPADRGLLIQYLQHPDVYNFQNTSHCATKLITNHPTIYVYGDIVNAIISQYNRGILHFNATKINLDRNYGWESLEYFIENFPNDPLGIKKQYAHFKGTPNTIFLEYPYDRDALKRTLKKLGHTVDVEDFMVKPRQTNYQEHDMELDSVLKRIIKVYATYDFDQPLENED